MALIIPPGVNYPSPVQSIPSFMHDEPIDGRRQVACEALWNLSGANRCYSFNLKEISQLSTLKVDNSACGADVQFIWPNGEVITIPARTPIVVVPVFSNSVSFWLYAPRASDEDVTRFIFTNYVDPPTQGPNATNQTFVGAIAATWNNATVVTQMLPATEYGTLDTLVIQGSFNAGFPADSLGQFSLTDGAGNVFIPGWRISAGPTYNTATAGSDRLRLRNMNIRFRLGLILTFSVVTAWSGVANANAFFTYRKP